MLCHCDVRADSRLRIIAKNDSDWSSVTGDRVCTGDWHWIGCVVRRASSSSASDGVVRIYIDGVMDKEATGIDNYDVFSEIDLLRIGNTGYSRAGFVADFDEIVMADRLVELPLPAGKVWK